MRYLGVACVAIALCGLGPIARADVNAPANLQVVPRYQATISLIVSWTDTAPDETGFEVQRRPVGGSYTTVASLPANTQAYDDTTAGAAQSWEYRVRALSPTLGDSAWVGPSLPMRPIQVWPMDDGSRDILDNYGMPLLSANPANGFYFHRGVDISGSGVQVNVGRGGVISGIGGAAVGGQVNVTVDYGPTDSYMDPYAHIDYDGILSVGDVMAPGARLGTVRDDFFNRSDEADHVHWGSRDNLTPFTNNADRDPGGNAPVVADANDDGEDFIVVDANNNDHNNPREPAWRDVDFLVDAYDDMSTGNTLEQGLFNIGYWIQAVPPDGENVRSAADPYKLIEFGPGGYTPGGPAPTGAVENAVIYWTLPADLQGIDTWQSYFTWIVTNTRGSDGSGANADPTQHWRTDARKGSGTQANGSDAARAREIQEARFPDGTYFVHILPSDHVQTADHVRSVDVDNFRPYVEKLTVFSGPRIVYQATWRWDAGTAQLEIQPATFAAAAAFTALRTQDVIIEVEFSEPMATASVVSVSPLGATPLLTSTQPAHAQTIWRGLISHVDIADDGSDDGTHMLAISGTDKAGNALLEIASRAAKGPNHNNRSAAGNMQGTAGQDSIHGFRIGPLEGVVPVTAIYMKQGATDPVSPTTAEHALQLQSALNDYFDEASYGELSFAVTPTGWYRLDQPLAWYFTNPQTPLIDLVQEAVTKATADGVSLEPYVLVVTDETAVRPDWSTSGAWPYELPGGPRLLASGVLNLATTNARVTHLMGRPIGFIDLFEHPDVTVARPFVGPWSHMSDQDSEVHPLGWEKWRVGWLDETGTATGKTLTRVAKPPSGSPIANQSHTLLPLDANTNGVKLLAIELADRVWYCAEYRRQQNLDAALPGAGVVLVKTDEAVAQGEGPVIVQESPVTAGNLADAPFTTAAGRNVFDDVGSGVRLEVISSNVNQAIVRLDYEVPATQNDLFVDPHDDRWKSDDIWVDAPDLSGSYAGDPLDVINDNEAPRVGEVNRVYGRVRNIGRAHATNFEVRLEIREPWGTGVTWRELKVETVALLQGRDTNPNDKYLIMAEWQPTAGEHSCVKLSVTGVANDINTSNNSTQENISEFVSTSGSPYSPINSRFTVENPYQDTVPVLFRVDGLPVGWTYTIVPERPLLAPQSVADAQVTIIPDPSSPLCSKTDITVTAYAPRVDTLKRLGAITLTTALKSPASIEARTWLDCRSNLDKELLPTRSAAHRDPLYTEGHVAVEYPQGEWRRCSLVTKGCVTPGVANEQVAIVYTAPNGQKAVRYVTTDADGCFLDIVPVVAGGLWETQVVLEGTDCRGEARGPRTWTVAGIPGVGGFPGGTDAEECIPCVWQRIIAILVILLLLLLVWLLWKTSRRLVPRQ